MVSPGSVGGMADGGAGSAVNSSCCSPAKAWVHKAVAVAGPGRGTWVVSAAAAGAAACYNKQSAASHRACPEIGDVAYFVPDLFLLIALVLCMMFAQRSGTLVILHHPLVSSRLSGQTQFRRLP